MLGLASLNSVTKFAHQSAVSLPYWAAIMLTSTFSSAAGASALGASGALGASPGSSTTSGTVGASGAVYGILLAFGMMFPESRILVFFVLPVKAKYLVIGYAILELMAGLGSSADGIAHFAHLGGMIFGFLLIMYWKKKRNNGSYNY